MYRGDGIAARVVSFGLGGGVMFIGGPLLGLAFGDSLLVFAALALAYAVIAGIVAFIWPQLGWRTGLWFFAFFPLAVFFAFLFTLEIPINWRTELIGLLLYSPGFFAACLGGWLGSVLRRRSSANQVPSQPSFPASSPTH